MLQAVGAPKSEAAQAPWPKAAEDRKQPDQRVEVEAATETKDTATQTAADLEALKLPDNEKDLRKAILEQDKRIRTLDEVRRGIGRYVSDKDKRDLFPLDNFPVYGGLIAGGLIGAIAGPTIGTIAGLCHHSLHYGLVTAGMWFGISMGFGVISAATILIKDCVSAATKNARYYIRRVMFRVTCSNLDDEQETEIMKASIQTLDEEQAKLKASVNGLKGHLDTTYGQSIRQKKDEQYKEILDDIKNIMK